MLINKTIYHAIGLMSGSSLDGVDIVYCTFTSSTKWQFEILESETVSLGKWEKLLPKAVNQTKEELAQTSVAYGSFLAEITNTFIQKHGIEKIDIVSSHGHTIFHYPQKGITCQIGEGQTMANILKLPVINNLRQKDIDAGGQGAPIVPIGDLHLFPQFKFCLNVGGIANISVKQNNSIIAYDIAMANQILNYYSSLLEKEYDNEGILAREGNVNNQLLDELNQLAFYKKQAPKSLDNGYKNHVFKMIDKHKLRAKDILATYTLHLSKVIATEANKYIGNIQETMLITGGGAYNLYLMELIEKYFNGKVEIPSKKIIEYKEALVMAFMGILHIRNEVNVLSSATGAKYDTICGELHKYNLV